jgi:hypothetical protein
MPEQRGHERSSALLASLGNLSFCIGAGGGTEGGRGMCAGAGGAAYTGGAAGCDGEGGDVTASVVAGITMPAGGGAVAGSEPA